MPGVPVQRVVGVTSIGEAREGNLKTADEGIPPDLAYLAGAVHQRALTVEVGDSSSYGGDDVSGDVFTGATGLSEILAGAGGISAIKQFIGGGKKLESCAEHLKSDDSLSKILGATEIESGATDLAGGALTTGLVAEP
ncbi:MAG: hypothetical protein GEV09_10195 [Pseudonocardiaceae bacterium]|nr:hypothetical protein [Pseudonocardiaceae bacterium]